MPWLDDDTDGSDPLMPDKFDWRMFVADYAGLRTTDEEREANEWAAQFEREKSDEDLEAEYRSYTAQHCADPDTEC